MNETSVNETGFNETGASKTGVHRTVTFSSLGGPDVLSIVDRPVPPPTAGEVQIAVKVAGLNRAELVFMAGTYLVDPRLPSGLGFEGAGEVVAVGTGVERFAVGDRVAITPAFEQNAYAVLGEIVNMPASALEPIADGVDYRVAAAFWMAFGTAYGLLVRQGGLHEGGGQSVVINAASSSVGTTAFQIVRAHGGLSIATTREAGKVDALKAAGADHVVVTTTENLVERVMAITDGKGFDIACDAVGGADGAALAEAAGFEATMVVYGLLSGEIPPLPFLPMVRRGLTVTGFHLAWLMLDHPERRERAVAHLAGALSSGTYRPLIDRVFAFEDVADAYRYLASNAQIGKILVEIGS